MKEVKMICIACPIGCRLVVYEDLTVTGNKCPKGEVYGVKELTNPTRIVTSTVKIEGGIKARIPVRTTVGVPKDKIREVMSIIDNVVLKAPVGMGEIIVKNVLDTDAHIVTSRSMEKK